MLLRPTAGLLFLAQAILVRIQGEQLETITASDT